MKLEESWIKMYGFAKRYYKKNHNLLVKTEYSIISHKEKIYLGSWISEQKKKYIDNALSYEQTLDYINEQKGFQDNFHGYAGLFGYLS